MFMIFYQIYIQWFPKISNTTNFHGCEQRQRCTKLGLVERNATVIVKKVHTRSKRTPRVRPIRAQRRGEYKRGTIYIVDSV